jgi:Glyoxalase-like domain
MSTSFQVVFDCRDPSAQAEFWAYALGYVFQPPPEGFTSWDDALRAWGVPESSWNDKSAIIDPRGESPRLFFQRVPEDKVVKNRLHLDINAGGGPHVPPEDRSKLVDDKVQQLRASGATIANEMQEFGQRWVVMQDPEGNEFCVQ